MPFFYRSSSVFDLNESLMLHRQDAAKSMIWQGTYTPNDIARPHTAGGTTSRKALQPFPESYLRTRRRGLSFRRSRSTTALPLAPSFDPPSPEDVGLAIGSPSQLVPPQVPAFAPSIDRRRGIHQPFEALEPTRAETEPTSKPTRPTVKRWKTVSGLFTRKKTSPVNTPPPPLLRVSEEVNHTPPRPSTSRPSNVSRTSSFFHRKSRAFTPPKTFERRFAHGPQLVTPTPGDARAFEAGEDPSTPHLRVNIPQSSLDRYSVMFSSLLEPSGVPQSQPVAYQPETDCPQPFPPRAQSLAPSRPQLEISDPPVSIRRKPVPVTVEPPIDEIAKAPWSARSSLRDLDAADEAEGIPAGVEAWALGLSSNQEQVENVTRRYSVDSYSTSIAPSLTSTDDTWDAGLDTTEKQPTAALPTFSFPPPSHVDATKPSQQPELHLAVPPRPSRQSWDEGLPSPGFAPSGSPRMKFGYDTPHSPLISVATTVTVSMRSGQGHRPQMVMRDSHHSARASYGRELGV